MKFKDHLARETRLPREILPGSYHILGNILLLKLGPKALKHKKLIANSIMKLYPYVKSIVLQKGISGELRKPKIEILAGSRLTEITHQELGCKFRFDVKKIMWSKGNHHERKRLLKLVKPKETIVDMFSGIGYFSIPIAKNTKAKRIICLEKNPESFDFLAENISLNKLYNMTAINDDCMNFVLEKRKKKADRIIMGYFPGTIKFLPYALKLSKPGAIIHYHDLAANANELKREILKAGKGKLKVINSREVKEYSPSKRHYVFDLEVTRTV